MYKLVKLKKKKKEEEEERAYSKLYKDGERGDLWTCATLPSHD